MRCLLILCVLLLAGCGPVTVVLSQSVQSAPPVTPPSEDPVCELCDLLP
jgi:uncharacterized lipoprotein YajG